jgi:hypothetical protein
VIDLPCGRDPVALGIEGAGGMMRRGKLAAHCRTCPACGEALHHELDRAIRLMRAARRLVGIASAKEARVIILARQQWVTALTLRNAKAGTLVEVACDCAADCEHVTLDELVAVTISQPAPKRYIREARRLLIQSARPAASR